MVLKLKQNEFLKITTEIGKNILFVQGAGGNCSFKTQNKLFIKASGFELKYAESKNIFVEVDYKKVLEGINKKKKDPLINTWDKKYGLRPSIETSLHAIIPYKYVMHVHCINSLSWLVQKNFVNKIIQKIKNEDVSIIPYYTPGIDLTNAIKKQHKDKIKKILLLSNHGIVISDDNLKSLLKNLESISINLSQKSHAMKKPSLSFMKDIAKGTIFKVTKYSISHQIALSAYSIKFALGGHMFPDQVIFHPAGFKVIFSKDEIKDLSNSIKNQKFLPALIIPNHGILVPKSISDKSEIIIQTLAMIINRIPSNAKINYLNKKEVQKLSSMESEIYRSKL